MGEVFYEGANYYQALTNTIKDDLLADETKFMVISEPLPNGLFSETKRSFSDIESIAKGDADALGEVVQRTAHPWAWPGAEDFHGVASVEGEVRLRLRLGERLARAEGVLQRRIVLRQREDHAVARARDGGGNALALEDGRVAVIDPAPSVGDGLADIAMMQLFGGFPDACFRGYRDGGGASLEPVPLAVYRLYHLLNHLRLFGAGYLGGVLRECRLILGATA